MDPLHRELRKLHSLIDPLGRSEIDISRVSLPELKKVIVAALWSNGGAPQKSPPPFVGEEVKFELVQPPQAETVRQLLEESEFLSLTIDMDDTLFYFTGKERGTVYIRKGLPELLNCIKCLSFINITILSNLPSEFVAGLYSSVNEIRGFEREKIIGRSLFFMRKSAQKPLAKSSRASLLVDDTFLNWRGFSKTDSPLTEDNFLFSKRFLSADSLPKEREKPFSLYDIALKGKYLRLVTEVCVCPAQGGRFIQCRCVAEPQLVHLKNSLQSVVEEHIRLKQRFKESYFLWDCRRIVRARREAILKGHSCALLVENPEVKTLAETLVLRMGGQLENKNLGENLYILDDLDENLIKQIDRAFLAGKRVFRLAFIFDAFFNLGANFGDPGYLIKL